MDVRILMFTKNDFKIIIFTTMIGAIVQIVCSKYVKDHPELFKEEKLKKIKPATKIKRPRLQKIFLRGGALLEFTGAKIIFDINKFILFGARKAGTTALIFGTGGVIVKKIPATAISKVVSKTRKTIQGLGPVTHSHYGKEYFILVDEKEQLELKLDSCSKGLKYLFKMLLKLDVLFKERKKLSKKTLIKERLDLSTS